MKCGNGGLCVSSSCHTTMRRGALNLPAAGGSAVDLALCQM